MGGLYALSYAKRFADDVAGLVLLDMRAPTFSEAAEQHKPGSSRPPWFLTALFPHHMKSEIRGAVRAEQQAATPEELGHLRITVVAASRRETALTPALQQVWRSGQKTFAERLTNGRFVMAEDCGHYIHCERPELAIREIVSVVEYARTYN